MPYRSFSGSPTYYLSLGLCCCCYIQEVVSCTNAFKATSHILSIVASVKLYVKAFDLLGLKFCAGQKRYGFICILLHADIQLCQHHLLKMFSFIHCIILASLSKKSGVHSFVDLSQGLQFSSIDPHVCFYANTKLFYCYSSILKLEIRDGDASRSFFVRIVLGLLAYVFHMKLRIVFTKSVK